MFRLIFKSNFSPSFTSMEACSKARKSFAIADGWLIVGGAVHAHLFVDLGFYNKVGVGSPQVHSQRIAGAQPAVENLMFTERAKAEIACAFRRQVASFAPALQKDISTPAQMLLHPMHD